MYPVPSQKRACSNGMERYASVESAIAGWEWFAKNCQQKNRRKRSSRGTFLSENNLQRSDNSFKSFRYSYSSPNLYEFPDDIPDWGDL
jgi:hypothetical protein